LTKEGLLIGNKGAKKRTSSSMNHARVDIGDVLDQAKFDITFFPFYERKDRGRWVQLQE
jgi:hypothetical protein